MARGKRRKGDPRVSELFRRRLRVAELSGGYEPAPVPPGYGQHALPPGVPLIETIETAKGPWQVNGSYGRMNRFTFPASLDADPIAVFSIDRQLGPPRPRTLHLFRDDSNVGDGVTPVNVDCYARITYGVGAVQNSFHCDWSRGGQISIVCDALRVEAVPYVQDASSPYLPPPGEQLLGCLLSHEGSAPPRPPTFSTAIVALANTESAVFPVPDFARWAFPVSPAALVSPASGIAVRFGNQQSFVMKLLPMSDLLAQLGTAVPGGCNTVEFTNNSGGQAIVGLQFELGL